MEVFYDTTETIDCEFEEKAPTGQQQQQQQQQQQSTTHATDQLEKCGKWLASIPRDDITVLRHTAEFREFLGAFEKLGHAHLRVVVNGKGHPGTSAGTNCTTSARQGESESDSDVINDNDNANSNANADSNAGTRKRNASHDYSFTHSNPDALLEGIPNNHYHPPQTTKAITTRNTEQRRREPTDQSTNIINTMTTVSSSASGSGSGSMVFQSNNNILRFTDDILLRILEFLQCKSLIQTSLTSSRFHRLVAQSATQRTYDFATTRQLGNVMQLLRAKEQLYYIQSEMDGNDSDNDSDSDIDNVRSENSDDDDDDDDAMVDLDACGERNTRAKRRCQRGLKPGTKNSNINTSSSNFSVPIPKLLLGKRVLVTNSSDPDYNGVYYCTDCNGNGYVFTKPRFLSQSRKATSAAASSSSSSLAQAPMETPQLQQQLEDMVFDEEINPLRQRRVVGGIQQAGRLPLDLADLDDVVPNGAGVGVGIFVEDRFQPQRQRQRQPQRASARYREPLPLRCIIAKAYSNHDILWYMSKEIESLEDNDNATETETVNAMATARKTTYSFYAPLMLSGDAQTELSVYPSQSSALFQQNQTWRSLNPIPARTIDAATGLSSSNHTTPILEVIDARGVVL